MIRIFISAVLYLITSFTQAQTISNDELAQSMEETFTIKAMVNQIQPETGTVYFAMYSSEIDFANRKAFQTRKASAAKGAVEVIFDNVPVGIYAITCFHDKNSNGKMDFSPNGIPEENYGSSNNVMNFGPPRFSDAKFEVSGKDLTFEIKF
mgnify:CR=1 FL=1